MGLFVGRVVGVFMGFVDGRAVRFFVGRLVGFREGLLVKAIEVEHAKHSTSPGYMKQFVLSRTRPFMKPILFVQVAMSVTVTPLLVAIKKQ